MRINKKVPECVQLVAHSGTFENYRLMGDDRVDGLCAVGVCQYNAIVSFRPASGFNVGGFVAFSGSDDLAVVVVNGVLCIA